MKDNRIDRRAFLKRAGGVIGGALAAGSLGGLVSCQAEATRTAQPAAATATPEPVTLLLKGWSFHPEVVEENLKRFMGQYPTITTEYEMVPFGEYREKIIAESIADVPLDVLYVPEDTVGAWADAGYLAPIDDMPGLAELKADMYPFSHQAMVHRGKQYCLPYFADTFIWAYNEKMINDAGFSEPPKNLDEVKEQCLAIKKAGLADYPLGLGLKKQAGQFWHMWAMVFASGGNLFDEENNPVFHDNDETLLNLLKWWLDAIHTWEIVPLEDLERTWGDLRPVMAAGEMAMFSMARYDLKMLNDPEKSEIAGHAKMAMFPGLERNDVGTTGFTHAHGLHVNCKNKDEAWKLLNYIGGKDADGEYYTAKLWYEITGLGPGYAPVMEDPAVIEMTEAWGEPELMKKQGSVARARQALKEPWYSEWEAFHQEQLQLAVLKETTPEDALKASAAKAIDLKKEWE